VAKCFYCFRHAKVFQHKKGCLVGCQP
jgi:hypothetical protein